MKYKKILLIDNFDSFTFNLVDYFKLIGCEVDVYRNNASIEELEKLNPDLLVISPGPSIPKNAGNLMDIITHFQDKLPIFGVCLGLEALVEHFGGTLKFVPPVHGKASEIQHDGKGIFNNINQNFKAGRYHSLVADSLPDCLEISANSEGLVMAIRHKELPISAVQFHPESVLSMRENCGFNLIENLVS